MVQRRLFFLAVIAAMQFTLSVILVSQCLAQKWAVRVKPKGTVRVVHLWNVAGSSMHNYAEGLVTLDAENNFRPCLAQDWRWIDEKTIEFKLREGVRFHNGERFNAESLRINWEAYKRLEAPRVFRFLVLSDETKFEILGDYTVRFIFKEPEGLAFVKFKMFFQIAPAFFKDHMFDENCWGYLPEPGPWGTGPFRLVEGGLRWGKPADRIVLEAYENYWDPRYPKVQRGIDTTLIRDRKEAMRLCRETEDKVDIVSLIRPLDTLKVAESQFANVVKSRDDTILWAFFNQRKRDSKWRDIRLRKALNYVVNRKELWNYAAKRNAYNLEGFPVPPGAYGHNPNLSLYSYDISKAKSLLTEAGFADGFEVRFITHEAFKLEAQIMSRMLERIGLEVRLEVLPYPQFVRKIYMPVLDNPPEEQDWDIALWNTVDYFGNTGTTFFTWGSLEESDMRWIEYDPVYEEKWKDMARTVDSESQEKKIQLLAQYLYEGAHILFIYSPISLYAVNKDVNFVPYKCWELLFKETSVTDRHWSVRGKI